MSKIMLINVLQPEECRIAILENGVLEELYVERTSHESYVGNIYKGRIVNIEPSIQAAFVDFGVGRNGFLHVSDVEPTYYRHLEQRRDSGRDGGRGRGRDRDRDRGRDRDHGRDRTPDRRDLPRPFLELEMDEDRMPPYPPVEDEDLTVAEEATPAEEYFPEEDEQPRGARAWGSWEDEEGAEPSAEAYEEPLEPEPVDEEIEEPEEVVQVVTHPPEDVTPAELGAAPVEQTRIASETEAPESVETSESAATEEAPAKSKRRKSTTTRSRKQKAEKEEKKPAEKKPRTTRKRKTKSSEAESAASETPDDTGSNEDNPKPRLMDSAERRTDAGDADDGTSFSSPSSGEEDDLLFFPKARRASRESVPPPPPPVEEEPVAYEPEPTYVEEPVVEMAAPPREEINPDVTESERGRGRDRGRDRDRWGDRGRRRGGSVEEELMADLRAADVIDPEPRETRDPRPPRESRGPRQSREPREPRETRETRENRKTREPQETRETRESREMRESREPREPREMRETREMREVPPPAPIEEWEDEGRPGFADFESEDFGPVGGGFARDRGGERGGDRDGARRRSPQQRNRRGNGGGNGGPRNAGRPKPLIQDVFRRGQEVIVQVIKEGLGSKGPTLSTYISIAGRYLVLMPGLNRVGVSRKIADEDQRRKLRAQFMELNPPEGLGFIIRTACEDKNKKELQRDLAYLSRLWQVVVRRIRRQKSPCEIYQESDQITRTLRDTFASDIDTIIVDEPNAYEHAREFLQIVMPRYADRIQLYSATEPLFHKYGIEEEIDRIQQRKVPLPAGGSIVIEQTEALVAIDVNSGNFRADNNAEETAFQINLQAAKEIARQLRLRDLGGVIVNDFIDMRDEKHRRLVEKALRDAVKRDRARTKVLRMSAFGIIEMTRQRIRPSLKRSVYHECHHCRGSGHVKTAESMSIEVMRLLQLAAHRDYIRRVEARVTEEVANCLHNRKRKEIYGLEDTGKMTVQITGMLAAPPEMLEFFCFDQNDNEVRLFPVEEQRRPPRR